MFVQHAEFLVLLPTITVNRVRCDNEECDAVHTIFAFTWLIWSLEVGT